MVLAIAQLSNIPLGKDINSAYYSTMFLADLSHARMWTSGDLTRWTSDFARKSSALKFWITHQRRNLYVPTSGALTSSLSAQSLPFGSPTSANKMSLRIYWSRIKRVIRLHISVRILLTAKSAVKLPVLTCPQVTTPVLATPLLHGTTKLRYVRNLGSPLRISWAADIFCAQLILLQMWKKNLRKCLHSTKTILQSLLIIVCERICKLLSKL